ncbi:DUF1102 domain-containing protein [Halorubrum sp. Atlit-28R]|uniref:DUF1102 domain-containing protein n=1 Tax=Halorubrum sp. Atlit-28R TaxID=2282129 RepID=UPI001314F7B2|nr:DUF1102 domain-containing protein [Halorubrum sp. Atlit-28R]
MADDSDALLAFETANSGPNSQYTETTGGTLSIDISGSNDNIAGGGEGINQNATTIIRDMFDIRNQGTQPVFAYVEDSPDNFGLFADFPAHAEPGAPAQPSSGPSEPTTGLGEGETGQDAISIDGGGNIGASIPARIYLEAGEALREVGTFFFGSNLQDVDGNITLKAVAVSNTEATVDTSPTGAFVDVTDPTP